MLECISFFLNNYFMLEQNKLLELILLNKKWYMYVIYVLNNPNLDIRA